MQGEVASILEDKKSREVQGMVHRYLRLMKLMIMMTDT